jgi:transcriptional regulator with XRE-family HTH domain
MSAQNKDSIFHASIGEVVMAWRKLRNLTVTELAQRSGSPISKGYISQLEHNKVRQPSEDHLVRIATALHIPVLYLVTRRLPDELSSEEQKEIAEERGSPDERAGGFTFGSPLPSPRRRQLNEEEELQLILAQLEDLRSRVKKLITRKGKQR